MKGPHARKTANVRQDVVMLALAEVERARTPARGGLSPSTLKPICVMVLIAIMTLIAKVERVRHQASVCT